MAAFLSQEIKVFIIHLIFLRQENKLNKGYLKHIRNFLCIHVVQN